MIIWDLYFMSENWSSLKPHSEEVCRFTTPHQHLLSWLYFVASCFTATRLFEWVNVLMLLEGEDHSCITSLMQSLEPGLNCCLIITRGPFFFLLLVPETTPLYLPHLHRIGTTPDSRSCAAWPLWTYLWCFSVYSLQWWRGAGYFLSGGLL